MEKRLYEIKPLEWQDKGGVLVAYLPGVDFYYSIRQSKDSRYALWCYFYSEDDDESYIVSTLEECKAEAQHDFEEWVSSFLQEADPDRWIPVEERLPELPESDHDAYYVFVKDLFGYGVDHIYSRTPMDVFKSYATHWKPIKD